MSPSMGRLPSNVVPKTRKWFSTLGNERKPERTASHVLRAACTLSCATSMPVSPHPITSTRRPRSWSRVL